MPDTGDVRLGSRPSATGGFTRAIAPQLIILTLVLLLQAAAWLGMVPPSDVLGDKVVALFERYGLPLVAVCSFAENFAGLGTYFPGSVALVLAMTLTSGDPQRAVLTYVAVVIPAIAANILSFWVGSWSRRPGPSGPRKLRVWYASTYWHPQLAGMTALAAGSSGVSLKEHVKAFLPISVAWSILWAVTLYRVGRVVAVPSALAPAIYIYLVVWILWDLRKYLRDRQVVAG